MILQWTAFDRMIPTVSITSLQFVSHISAIVRHVVRQFSCCTNNVSQNPYESTTTANTDAEPHLQPSVWVASSAAIAICSLFIVAVCVYGKPTVANGNVRFQFVGTIPLLPASDPYSSSVLFVETTILGACFIVCGLLVATLIATNLIAHMWRRARET